MKHTRWKDDQSTYRRLGHTGGAPANHVLRLSRLDSPVIAPRISLMGARGHASKDTKSFATVLIGCTRAGPWQEAILPIQLEVGQVKYMVLARGRTVLPVRMNEARVVQARKRCTRMATWSCIRMPVDTRHYEPKMRCARRKPRQRGLPCRQHESFIVPWFGIIHRLSSALVEDS